MKVRYLSKLGLPLLAVTAVVGYQNCSPGNVETARLSSTGSNSSTGLKLEDDLKPIQTITSESLEQSMMQLTGIQTPSTAARQAIDSANSKLSPSGDADTVNAAMMLAIANVAGEFCLQLVDQERAVTSDQRRFFKAVDFSRGPASVTPDQRTNVMKRLVRGFAAEDINSAELAYSQMMLSEFEGIPRNAGVSDQTETQNLMIYACSSVLSSLRASLIE